MMPDLNYELLERALITLFFAFLLGAPNSKQGLIALDQWVNTRLGGMADETISARSYRNRLTKRYWYVAYRVINAIFFLQKDHCLNAYLSELRGSQNHPDYRKPKE